MKRSALIIANPGQEGHEDFLGGVTLDVANFVRFLKSPVGGLWYGNEITVMNRPSASQVRLAKDGMNSSDYALIIFTGHGRFSVRDNATALNLNGFEEIDEKELYSTAAKETLIVDCCRKKSAVPIVTKMLEMAKKTEKIINPELCRRLYDVSLGQCSPSMVIMYSCSLDEFATDDSRLGGLYSYNLVQGAYDWSDATASGTGTKYHVFSVARAHYEAGQRIRNLRFPQTPHIIKPRSEPYFPFGVVA